MEVGTLLQWFKEEGDAVEVGDPLFEIMTDKINIEVESYEEGLLLKKYYQIDEEIPVNAVIGYVGEAGEDVPNEPPLGEEEAGSLDRTEETPSSETVESVTEIVAAADGDVRATPAARRVAKENDLSLKVISGSGPKGRVHEQDVRVALETNKILVTPLAEKIAQDKGIDLSEVTGSGVRGKIEKADVLAFADSQTIEVNTKSAERIKLTGLRKAVANKMLESTRNIPHVTLTSDVDMTKAIDLRKSVLSSIEKQTGYRVSYTEIIMKATAHALDNHPAVNASLIDSEIIMNKSVNLGLAVAVENGLIVPSVKAVNQKGLATLTEESKTLGKKARDNQLTPQEMTGSTFTISNLGMYAIDGFTPIINPPETAILGVGRIVEKPVALAGAIEIRPMMILSLSFDHRAIDGAPAAAFLTELKKILENPYSLLV